MAVDKTERSNLIRAVIASTVGTSIEWYDYFAYGTIGALVFPKLFFPKSDPLTGTLDVFSIFFLGFVARPIGALFFGHFGDRIGRKATLIATLLLMGIGTVLMGLLPTRAQIGIWAPLLLMLFRVAQGLGVGGEWGGSVVLSMEWGSNRRRGFVASWPQFGVPVGLLLSTAVVSIMLAVTNPAAFDAWGWRVPFLLSIILVAIGLWIRLGILETPIFRKLIEQHEVASRPVVEVIRKNWVEIILSAILRLPEQAPFYIFTTFVYTFGLGLHLQRGLLANGVVAASILSLFCVPFFGYLSDRVGRKQMYMAGVVLTGIWGFVYFGLYSLAIPALVFVVIFLSLIPHDMQYGPQSALIAESFTARLRYSGSSIGYQLASVIAGGPAPLIATYLFARTHNAYSISLYILLCSILGFIAVALLRDRSHYDHAADYSQQEGATAGRAAQPSHA